MVKIVIDAQIYEVDITEGEPIRVSELRKLAQVSAHRDFYIMFGFDKIELVDSSKVVIWPELAFHTQEVF